MDQKTSSKLSKLSPIVAIILSTLLFFAITTPPARSQSWALVKAAIGIEYYQNSSFVVEYMGNDFQPTRQRASDLIKDYDIEVTSLITGGKLLLSTISLLLTLIFSHFVLNIIGRATENSSKDEDETIIEAEQLRVITSERPCQSRASFAGVPMPGKTDTSNLIFCGSPGSGKTSTIRELLASIRKSGRKAIVFDVNGELISHFYRSDKDIILNPLDARSPSWDIWSDCRRYQDYLNAASNLIPDDETQSDWILGARLVLAELARQEGEQEKPENKHLIENIRSLEDQNVRDLLQDTEAATIIAQHGEDACYGIRGILISALNPLMELDGEGARFSVRRWAFNETNDSWLFISSHVIEADALRPLTTAWLDMALRTIQAWVPDHLRRFFVVIDDLHSLNKISSLPDLMVQSRRLGICTVLGIQSVPQITRTYGDELTKTILRSCDNMVAMRTLDSETQQWLASRLGSTETIETIEISYGSKKDKLHTERLLKIPLVAPESLSELPELNGYIRFGNNYPTARFKGAAKALPMISEPFISKIDRIDEQPPQIVEEESETEQSTPEPDDVIHHETTETTA